MMKMLSLVILIGAGAALIAPLLYGLSTLRGMKRKSYVPLLRLKRRDGTLSVMKQDYHSA